MQSSTFFLGAIFGSFFQCTSIWFHHWLSNTNCFFVRTRVIIHQPQCAVHAFIFPEICFHFFKLFGKFTKRTYQQNRTFNSAQTYYVAYYQLFGNTKLQTNWNPPLMFPPNSFIFSRFYRAGWQLYIHLDLKTNPKWVSNLFLSEH